MASSKSGGDLKANPSFDNFRAMHFEEIAQNRSSLFNFFFENNDIFRLINEEDENLLRHNYFKYMDRTSNYTIGSFFTVLFIDQVALRFAMPSFRIPYLRPLVFLGKYLGVPLLTFKYCKNSLCKDIDETFQEIANKYNFSYADYNNVIDILERAERVGRLDELLEKRSKFDWADVPELVKKDEKKK